MSASRSTGHCRCCYQPYNIPGVSRARENRTWRAYADAGEYDHPANYPNYGESTVHDLDMPATHNGDGAWDYDQGLADYGWYHGVIPPHARLPHEPGTVGRWATNTEPEHPRRRAILRGMTFTRIAQLKFYPGNARRSDIDLIADSLRVNGQYKPVVVNKGTHAPDLADTILAGNHTVTAAQRLGWSHVDTHYVDVDDSAAKCIVLVDNRANDQATYEPEELAALVGDVGPLDGTGFTQDDLNAMLEALDNTTDGLLEEGDGDAPEGYDLTVECESADQRDTLKAKLLAECFTVS